MKKAIAIILALCSFLFAFSSCKTVLIERGKWKNGVYYNEYGRFKITPNSFFDVYSDEKIKKELGAVYPADNMLNDMVISSDYCAIIVTLERTAVSYTQSEYVDQFIANTREKSGNAEYDLAEPFDREIAGRRYTCVAVRYPVAGENGDLEYFEYSFICKSESGIFIILRVTAGTQDHIFTGLGIVQSY